MDDTGHANKGDFFLGFIIYCHAIYMHASKQCVQCNECYKSEIKLALSCFNKHVHICDYSQFILIALITLQIGRASCRERVLMPV